MDSAVNDQKLRDLQSKLPFVKKVIERLKARPIVPGRLLEKFEKVHKLIEVTKRQRVEIAVIIRAERALHCILTRCDTAQANESVHNDPVKHKASDSPSTTRPFGRTSSIEIQRSVELKKKKEDHRYRPYNERLERPTDKYGSSKYESSDRNRSQYDKHLKRSKSRDRNRSDRRDRSDSSKRRPQHDKNDRNRYRHKDSRDDSKKKHDQRTDRVVKAERSDRYSPSSQRDSCKRGKSLEKDFQNVTINRSGTKPSSTVVKSYADDDDRSKDEIAEMPARNKMLHGCETNDEKSKLLKNLKEVRAKLATQIKLKAESQSNKGKSSPPPSTSNEIPAKITGYKFESIPLRECTRTPPNNSVKDNKMIQAVETSKDQQQLALKHNPKVKYRSVPNVPETTTQPHHQPEVSQQNNFQPVCFNDQRVQVQQDPRFREFSPSSTPHYIPNYPPIIQSSSGYKQNVYRKPTSYPFVAQSDQHGVYRSTVPPQLHQRLNSNLITITPHNNPRSSHSRWPPVGLTGVSCYPYPSFPEPNQNSSGMHNEFRPSLNDNVERHKYQQPRARSKTVFYEKPASARATPKTYGEYKRSIRATVSSTTEKVNQESKPRAANISTSHHDEVYRSDSHSTVAIPSTETKSTGAKFKIPKKATVNKATEITHTPKASKSRDSEAEQSSARGVQEDSDDSKREISGNGKTVTVNSDNASDPRVPMEALKTAPSFERTKNPTEKQNSIVTSSTSVVPENVPTTENVEFLKHLTNPNNLLALIKLVGQMTDDSTLTTVKEVLEKAKEAKASANTSIPTEENAEHLSTSMERETIDVPKTSRKNELDRLNEDIRTMFISDGVLNATGRRVCALYNNDADSKAGTHVAKMTPESKIAAEKRKSVNSSTNAAKTKKRPSEPVEDLDETPSKRVTRAQMKECNVVLEKLSPDASVESITNEKGNLRKEVKGKRPRNGAMKQAAVKKAKEDILKNINPELHSLTKLTQCQVCGRSDKQSMVNHYVNAHPNTEVVTCRLAPDVADALRKSKVVPVAKRVEHADYKFYGYDHWCHFCNVSKILTRTSWKNHLARHTGYYQYRCNDCPRSFAHLNKSHACKGRSNLSKLPQPQFHDRIVKGYICDLCNFVRFHQNEMVKHLRCEHLTTFTDQFKKVTFLKFPENRQNKCRLELEDEEEEYDEQVSDNDDEVIGNSSAKRQKLITDSDSLDKDNSYEKVLRSHVVRTSISAEPNEGDDKNTTKSTKENTIRSISNGTESIVEELSERFNSVQENSSCMSEGGKSSAKTEQLNPLNCDEDIPVIRVTASDDSHVEGTSVESVSRGVQISNTKSSPSRENDCTPTEESDDDGWESCSSDDSDMGKEVDHSVVVQRQPDRKNVGIIDTIARLQQSIASQATAAIVDGVEKSRGFVKDKGIGELISVASAQNVDRDSSITQSEDQDVQATNVNKSMESESQIEGAKKIHKTYEAIVIEAMRLDSEDASGSYNVKKCVSTGRSPNGNHSSNFKGETDQTNADSTIHNVGMMGVNDAAAKILTRIDNIGYITRSTRASDCNVSFCCLIDDCTFESTYLTYLLAHIVHHSVKWSGYCYICDAQVKNERLPLMMEFMHLTTAHFNKKDDKEIIDMASTAGQSSFDKCKINCKMLPGDKLSKLKEEEIAAKAEPSTTSFIKVEAKFLKIPNAVSLGSAIKKYSARISLKEWLGHRTKKLRKHCKKMLSDICLYALFKCMDTNCPFTTDNADNMLIHLRNHENAFCEPTWLECAYCDIVADSCALLVKHIQDEHQSSIFQCPYCFYRSCVAFNVVVHLKQFHPSDKESVLVCNGKPRMYATEKALIERSRRENIRPLCCTDGCNKMTYRMDRFVKHMQSSHSHNETFKCQYCSFDVSISQTSKHLLAHSVGVYECVYCRYGVNDVESIQNHMCNTHPSKLLYICVRLTRKDRVLSEEEQRSVESTLVVHLGRTVDNKLFQRCPFTDDQLSAMDPLQPNPVVPSNSKIIETTVASSSAMESITLSVPPTQLNIASVSSISNESFANVAETVATTNTGLMLSDVLSYKDLERDYMSDDWDQYFATLTNSATKTKSKRRVIQIRKSSVPQVKVKLPESEQKNTASRPDPAQDEVDNAAYMLVKRTGFESRDLYRCSFPNCDERSDDILCFNVHLLNHTQSDLAFKCYHCSVTYKNIDGLIHHIRVHGIHRYFCAYCNYTSATNDIKKHIRSMHGKAIRMLTIPLNPEKRDQNKDMFVVCPRGILREKALSLFRIALIDRNKCRNTATKRDVESSLPPRQEICNSSADGQPNVSKWKCSLCYECYETRELVCSHMQTVHSIECQYECDICSEVRCNNKMVVQVHIALQHRNQDSRIKVNYMKVECAEN